MSLRTQAGIGAARGDHRDSAGIVLAGGRSSRMGTAKAALEWHGSTLVFRTAAILARVVDGPVVVVAAPGQDLPRLPGGVAVVVDPEEGRGPMQGIATGLHAVGERAEAAFVCSTDLPFLHPAFVARVLRSFGADGETDVVLPVARGYRQPLAAGYRTRLVDLIEERLADGDLRPGMLYRHCRVLELSDGDLLADEALSRADPELDSLLNINEPADYTAARARLAPEVVVERFGTLAASGDGGGTTVRAATLGSAAQAAALVLDQHVLAALNGDQITREPELPLVVGDTVAFITADGGG